MGPNYRAARRGKHPFSICLKSSDSLLVRIALVEALKPG